MGQSVAYRGIYLMIVLSGLLLLGRRVRVPAVQSQIKWATLSVIPLMWDGALQYWLSVGLPDRLAGGVEVALWLFRELAWVNLARVLLALLLVYAMETPVGRRWLAP
jgi:hypothetical protein